MTLEDPEFLKKRAAYIDHLRAMGRPIRWAGLAAIIFGVALLAWSRVNPALPAWSDWVAYAFLAAGWLAFIYVVAKRSQWVRANPFDPNS